MAGSSDSIAWLKQRLGDQVVPVPVQGDQPLLLDDPSCAYITLSEQHQLFCVGYRDGQPLGRREHLAVCGPGQLLCGLEPARGRESTALLLSSLTRNVEPTAFLLSGMTGSVVWRVPMAALLSLSRSDEGRRVLAGLFDRWIELLTQALPPSPVPARARVVSPGETIEGDSEIPLRVDRGVVWVAPPVPPRSYRGMNVHRLGTRVDCWPLSSAAWALCEPGQFRVWSTEQLLQNSQDAAFVSGFYAFVSAVVSARRTDLGTNRLMRDAASRKAEGDLVSTALGALASVGSGRGLPESEPGDHAFGRACRHIFRAIDLQPEPRVVKPRGSGLSHMQAALGRMTGVRSRGVLLEGAFHRDDNGPLLAFIAENDERLHPVALLPDRRGYSMFDPRDGRTTRVDAATVERLHPQAHQFYRTMPATPLGPLDVLRFSAKGMSPDLIRVVVVGMASGLVGTFLPLLTGQVFDRIIPGAERGLLWQLIGVLLAVFGGSLLFDLTRGFALTRVQTRMDATLEAGVWDRLLNLPLPFFRQYSAGDLASRAAGIGSIRELLASVGLSTILSGIFSVWNFALLFHFSTALALAATGLVALAGGVAAAATYYELGLRRRLVELDGRIGGLLLQLLSGIAKLRVSGSENRAFSVWARLFAQRRDADMSGERISTRVTVFHSVYPVLCSIVLFWLMAGGGEKLSTGQFLAFSAAFGVFMRAVLDVIGAGLRTLTIVPIYERAKPILTSPVEHQGSGDVRIELEGGLELSHVSFRYEANGPLILDDLTLRIEPGEFVAVVGPSGSGKSTLLRIMLGFEAPAEGGVFFDGQALVGMDIRAVRQQIGVVLQHSRVMAGDIYTNIVGNSGLTIEDAWRAARGAAFDKDVEAMPMGMHTVLAQGGGTLSGGQRQRLLIARALAAQPKILFFDEATSALDNRTQAVVSESLEALRVTRMVIAHRLSTIRHADRIVVLERGKIVQMGRFDALLAEGGAFGALARRQMV